MAAVDDPQRQTPAAAGRFPKWIGWIAAILTTLFVWFYLRGTSAAANPREPASAEEGVLTRLVLDAEGRREIRTSVVIPVPLETAWSILSDYDEWEKLFKTVRKQRQTEPLDGNRHHVVSQVLTPLGTLELDFIVTHEETADGGYVARWDAPTAELPVNQGTIKITPLGPEQTLFVYSIRKEYRRYPAFLVNNVLLGHQTDLVETLRNRMVAAARAP